MTARTCPTCNAPRTDVIQIMFRCAGCYARPDGNTKWAPVVIVRADAGSKP